jgi:mannose-6-phosphate isomerase-like protein (cupin superfamily)
MISAGINAELAADIDATVPLVPMGQVEELPHAADPDATLRAAGLKPNPWSAGAGARFSPHSHSADKHLYVVEGSIDFDGLELQAGEGILIPANTTHSAVVGDRGVTCVEAFGAPRDGDLL